MQFSNSLTKFILAFSQLASFSWFPWIFLAQSAISYDRPGQLVNFQSKSRLIMHHNILIHIASSTRVPHCGTLQVLEVVYLSLIITKTILIPVITVNVWKIWHSRAEYRHDGIVTEFEYISRTKT